MSLVLVVEDNENNMELITTLLDEEGYEVITASNGAAGLSLASAALPDLILMDVSLPLINGLDATTVLKRERRTCDIPVIALTAHAMRGDKERCLAAGCDDYDTKPLDEERILAKVKQHIANRSPDFVRLLEQTRSREAGSLDTGHQSAKLQELQTELDNTHRALTQAKADTNALATKLQEQKTLSAQRGQRREADFNQRLAFLKSKVEESVASSKSEQSALRAARDQALQELAQARAENAQATEQVQALKDQVAELEAQLSERPAGTDLSALDALQSQHESELAAAVSAQTARIQELETALEAANKAGKNARRTATSTRRLAAEKRLAAAQDELTAAQDRAARLEAELNRLTQERMNVPTETKLLQAELRRALGKLSRAQKSLSKLQEVVRGAVDASFREAMYDPEPSSYLGKEFGH